MKTVQSSLFPIYVYKIEELDLSKIDVLDGEGLVDEAIEALMQHANDAGRRGWELVKSEQNQENPCIYKITYKKPSFV